MEQPCISVIRKPLQMTYPINNFSHSPQDFIQYFNLFLKYNMRPNLTSFSNKLLKLKTISKISNINPIPIKNSVKKSIKNSTKKYNYNDLLINLLFLTILLLIIAMILHYRYKNKSTTEEKQQKLVNFVNTVKYHIDKEPNPKKTPIQKKIPIL